MLTPRKMRWSLTLSALAATLITLSAAQAQDNPRRWTLGGRLGYEVDSQDGYTTLFLKSTEDSSRGIDGEVYEVGLMFDGADMTGLVAYAEPKWSLYASSTGTFNLLVGFGVGGILRESDANDALLVGMSASGERVLRSSVRIILDLRYMRATASPHNLGLIVLGLGFPL